MYGPGYPQPPYFGYPPPPQTNGVVYVPYPMQTKGGKGRKGMNQRVAQDPLAVIAKAQDDLAKLEKMFKKEDKKEEPKKESFLLRKQLSLLETIGIQFILWLPTTGVLYLILKGFVR
jgi:hypothetical protein